MIKILNINEIYKKCEMDRVFDNTLELDDFVGTVIGQERAENSLKYGLSVNRYGYNIFVSGEKSSLKEEYVKQILNDTIKNKQIPDDLTLVYNFKNNNKPILIRFSPGYGNVFKSDMEALSTDIKESLTKFFSGAEYSKKIQELEQKYSDMSYKLFQEYEEKILGLNFMLTQTKEGYAAIPLDSKGRVMSQYKMNKYFEKNEEKYLKENAEINLIILDMIHEDADLQSEKIKELEEFEKVKASEIVNQKVEGIKEKYIENEKINDYIKDFSDYVVENLSMFKPKEDVQIPIENTILIQDDDVDTIEDYISKTKVNVIVDNSELKTAPVIFSKELDEHTLFGGVEYDTDKRTSVIKSDFSNIVAGDILKANGGYIVIDIYDVETEVWSKLKKVIKNKEIKFNSKNISTVILSDMMETEPIDIDVKVVILGDYNIYSILFDEDVEFRELFKVHAIFEDECDRNMDTELEYAKLISDYCKKNNISPLTFDAISKVIEYSSRLADSQSKLALYYSDIYNVLIEADLICGNDNRVVIEKCDIENALKNQKDRIDIASKRYIEQDKKDIVITTVSGERVGEINGLSVLDYGDFTIGKVAKITANTYSSKEYGMISVDKEAKMSGPLHNKSMSIIKGFLGEQFAKESPISLSVNISFEQSYGGIDGDSATLAETCAILSNMSGVPIKQNIAITGSMNQKGDAQIIGGVNDKIEGFFRTCKAKNAISGAGVIIPRANIEELMLSDEIQSYVESDEFTIYAIDTIYDAIEILTGLSYKEIKQKIIFTNNYCKNIEN